MAEKIYKITALVDMAAFEDGSEGISNASVVNDLAALEGRVEFVTEKWNIEYGFAKLDEATTKKIYRICKRTYKLLQLRDYGRIDLRLTADNKIVILEVNPNPDIAYGEEVAEAAEKVGVPYEKLIKQIISTAMSRYKS